MDHIVITDSTENPSGTVSWLDTVTLLRQKNNQLKRSHAEAILNVQRCRNEFRPVADESRL